MTETVKKSDLVSMLNHEEEAFHLTRRESEAVLNMTVEKIESSVAKGGKVSIPGFGHFEKVHREARSGRNPQTGDKLEIPARDVPVFKAGKEFKTVVSGK